MGFGRIDDAVLRGYGARRSDRRPRHRGNRARLGWVARRLFAWLPSRRHLRAGEAVALRVDGALARPYYVTLMEIADAHATTTTNSYTYDADSNVLSFVTRKGEHAVLFP